MKKERKIKRKGKLERKIIISMIIIFMIVMISTCATVFIVFVGETVVEQQEKLMDIAAFAPDYVDRFYSEDELQNMSEDEVERAGEAITDYGEFIDNWLENGPDDHYYEVKKRLQIGMAEQNLSDIFIYKAARDEKGNVLNDMTVVIDLPDRNGNYYDLGENFGQSQAFETVKNVYETGKSQNYNRLATVDRETFLVAYVPLKYADGTVCAVMGLEVDFTRIIITMIGNYYVLIIDAALNFMIFGIVAYLFIKISVVKPVGIISSHMNRFVSNEGTLVFEPISEIHTRDEIEQMADDYNLLAQRTIDYTKNLEIKTTEEERLKVDLDVASKIRSVISSDIAYPAFPERSDFDLCASLRYTMYNRCSFCNYFFTDTNRLLIVVGEPLGSNIASMIFSVLSMSYIKSFAKMGFEPYKIAAETNNELCSVEKKDAGLTIGVILADIDLKTGSMKYVNAGMPPMLIKKPGENFVLDKPDKPFSLGQMRGVSFEQKTIQLYQGSTIVFTSLGVSEMSSPKGKKYGFDRLVSVMNKISGNVYDLDKTINELDKDLDEYRDDAAVTLDTAILGFRYFG